MKAMNDMTKLAILSESKDELYKIRESLLRIAVDENLAFEEIESINTGLEKVISVVVKVTNIIIARGKTN